MCQTLLPKKAMVLMSLHRMRKWVAVVAFLCLPAGLTLADDPDDFKTATDRERLQQFLRSMSLKIIEPAKQKSGTPAQAASQQASTPNGVANAATAPKPKFSPGQPAALTSSSLTASLVCSQCGGAGALGQCSGAAAILGAAQSNNANRNGKAGSGMRNTAVSASQAAATSLRNPAARRQAQSSTGSSSQSTAGQQTTGRQTTGAQTSGGGQLLPRVASTAGKRAGPRSKSPFSSSKAGLSPNSPLPKGRSKQSTPQRNQRRGPWNPAQAAVSNRTPAAQANNRNRAIAGNSRQQMGSNRSRTVTVPWDWEVVRPAGSGPKDRDSAISTEKSKTNDTKQGAERRHLSGGVLRSSLQTGPQNPLVLPPNIASVVYVIDCSGSMNGNKYSRVVGAVTDAVEQMQPNQKFGILLFHTAALKPRGITYRKATPANASALQAALDSISPSGGTNPGDALLLAIQLKPESIVVLSDGEFQEAVVHRVTRLNRTSGANSQINCVAVGTQVRSLQILASLNSGSYTQSP